MLKEMLKSMGIKIAVCAAAAVVGLTVLPMTAEAKMVEGTFIAGRIDPVEYVGVSQQRNGNVRNRNHPLCGCATLVIQKTPFHYNRGVQATI